MDQVYGEGKLMENAQVFCESFVESVCEFLNSENDQMVGISRVMEKLFDGGTKGRDLIDSVIEGCSRNISFGKDVRKQKEVVLSYIEYYENKIQELNGDVLTLHVREETLKRKLTDLEKHAISLQALSNPYERGDSLKNILAGNPNKNIQHVMRDHEMNAYIQKWEDYTKLKKDIDMLQAKLQFLKLDIENKKIKRQKEIKRFERELKDIRSRKHKAMRKKNKLPGMYQNREIRAEMIQQCDEEIDNFDRLHTNIKKAMFLVMEEQTQQVDEVEAQYSTELNLLTDSKKLLEVFEYDPDFAAATTRLHKNKVTKYPMENIIVVLTDIENSTSMWQKNIELSAASLAVHNQCLRDIMDDYNGYEFKFEGDSFLIAFHSVTDSLNFCVKSQYELMKCNWPRELDKLRETKYVEINEDDSTTVLFRGFRVRMGIHTGKDIMLKIDEKTKRADYIGPVVNKTARIASLAKGGQIFCSDDVYHKIRVRDLDYGVLLRKHGDYELKGIKGNTVLYCVIPKELKKRSTFFEEETLMSLPTSSKKLYEMTLELQRENIKKKIGENFIDNCLLLLDIANDSRVEKTSEQVEKRNVEYNRFVKQMMKLVKRTANTVFKSSGKRDESQVSNADRQVLKRDLTKLKSMILQGGYGKFINTMKEPDASERMKKRKSREFKKRNLKKRKSDDGLQKKKSTGNVGSSKMARSSRSGKMNREGFYTPLKGKSKSPLTEALRKTSSTRVGRSNSVTNSMSSPMKKTKKGKRSKSGDMKKMRRKRTNSELIPLRRLNKQLNFE